MNATLSHANEFQQALQTHAPRFGVPLDADMNARLSEYYEQLNLWNARLHLVAPCPPAQFVTRHILESLLAAQHLPGGASIADVGSGSGLPVIPCLIARPDIQRATLIEANARKSIFLRETLRRVAPQSNAVVVNKRFEAMEAPAVEAVTCRALERFTEKFDELVRWSPPASSLLFFGGPALRERIEAARLSFSTIHLPESEQRYLFIIKPQA
ncbi:MAG: rRNA (guanine527-N7)-methyltransferase [Blastocatellia bacterium]|jgi:16S rRNA (guanine527-N7)-methyltransferase|nr:rRNA (guanine527-N7)-methyltransferase [Blastocatellia bacterium]